MKYSDELFSYNKGFVEREDYTNYQSEKYPNKKIAILTCMDTRLVQLLPASIGVKNGDVIVIKNAGGLVSHPFGSIMRSIMVAIYQLGVEELMIIGHDDCGMYKLDAAGFIDTMQQRGISEETISMISYCGVDLKKWLSGFNNTEESVAETMNSIRNHPLIPRDMSISGFIINPMTGQLRKVEDDVCSK